MAASWKPRINFDTKEYWEGCARKALVLARCEACKNWIHPPRALCSKCWSDDIGHYEASGDAKIFTYTVVPGRGEGDPSKVTVWAELAEQERVFVIGDLIDGLVNGLAIGDPIKLVWVDFHGTTVPGFRREIHA